MGWGWTVEANGPKGQAASGTAGQPVGGGAPRDEANVKADGRGKRGWMAEGCLWPLGRKATRGTAAGFVDDETGTAVAKQVDPAVRGHRTSNVAKSGQ